VELGHLQTSCRHGAVRARARHVPAPADRECCALYPLCTVPTVHCTSLCTVLTVHCTSLCTVPKSSAHDPTNGHIPDLVDRCGVGSVYRTSCPACHGKPPLLSWSAWEVYKSVNRSTSSANSASSESSATSASSTSTPAARAFLEEMYPVIEGFHRYWYRERDVRGVGLASYTNVRTLHQHPHLHPAAHSLTGTLTPTPPAKTRVLRAAWMMG
jgi:hypothetical protein